MEREVEAGEEHEERGEVVRDEEVLRRGVEQVV